jgi:release factor glutamine methyltransferase
VLVLSPATTSEIVVKLRAAGCVFAEDEAQLLIAQARSHDELFSMIDERTAGLPLEHILGWAEFCNMRIQVTRGVFVPRRRTEVLVREAAALIRHTSRSIVVDLCCGSGAVGAVLSTSFQSIELHAVDVDLAAVRCARRNIARGQVYQGHLYDPLPTALQGHVDLLIANAPYVPTKEIRMLPPEARLHEPPSALDGGLDGLDVHREIAAGASRWLRSGGHLLVECSEHHASRTVEIFASNGLETEVIRSEELGATVVAGVRRSPHQ